MKNLKNDTSAASATKPAPAAFLVVEIADINDEALYAEYRSGVSPGIRAVGGQYLVRGGSLRVLEGTWQPRRLVIIQFGSFEEAQRWWESAAYEPLKRMRQRSTTSNMILVEGVAEEVT